MPKFLIDKLTKEYPHNPSAVWGTLNKIGAVKGNKETAKGREMEKKHMAKEKEIAHIEIHPVEEGGHIVEHHYKPASSSKSGAFMDRPEPTKHVFGKGEGKAMMNHLSEHLGIGAAKAAGTAEEELEPAKHEPPHERDSKEEEISEGA